MSQFTIGAYEMENAVVSDFSEFLAIIKGRSVISAADWGDDRFELGLSGNLMIRFFQTEDGMTINLISTQNANENPSLVVDLGNMEQRVPISIIENKSGPAPAPTIQRRRAFITLPIPNSFFSIYKTTAS